MNRHPDPQELARELLGREFAQLEPDEQRVLTRIASGSLLQPDADELAQANATWGDRLADRVAAVGGSWGFIIGFGIVLFAWAVINTGILPDLGLKAFDAYPFIFLNLMLSMLAAVQAPIILMSQNRQAMKDRITARHDYEVNLRTQLEILRLARRLDAVAHDVKALSSRGESAPPPA